MANFYMTLPAEEIARQVADMLNKYNQLKKRHTAQTILRGAGAYFVDVVGQEVVGCQALLRENSEASRLFHLCVIPTFRGRGIARKLKETALSHVETPMVYVTIREDNIPSIRLNESLGFRLIKTERAGDHNVLTLARMMIDVRPTSAGMVVREPGRDIQMPGVSPDGLFYTGHRNRGGN